MNLDKLQTLVEFGIEYNNIVGDIPQTIFNIFSLEILNLDKNNPSSILPREIGNLSILKELCLRGIK